MTVNGLPVIAVHDGGADDRGQSGGRDHRRQPVGDRQHHQRDLHGDADRQHGVLSATAPEAPGIRCPAPGRRLTISGTLSEVNADLATLTDTDGTAARTDNHHADCDRQLRQQRHARRRSM